MAPRPGLSDGLFSWMAAVVVVVVVRKERNGHPQKDALFVDKLVVCIVASEGVCLCLH